MTATYQGKPCKLGHTERYASSDKCVACTSVNNRMQHQRLTRPAFLNAAVATRLPPSSIPWPSLPQLMAGK